MCYKIQHISMLDAWKSCITGATSAISHEIMSICVTNGATKGSYKWESCAINTNTAEIFVPFAKSDSNYGAWKSDYIVLELPENGALNS